MCANKMQKIFSSDVELAGIFGSGKLGRETRLASKNLWCISEKCLSLELDSNKTSGKKSSLKPEMLAATKFFAAWEMSKVFAVFRRFEDFYHIVFVRFTFKRFTHIAVYHRNWATQIPRVVTSRFFFTLTSHCF